MLIGILTKSGRRLQDTIKNIQAMEPRIYQLNGDRVLLVREAAVSDARAVLSFVETISGETDFLTFGSGEFELTEADEADFLRTCAAADNQLYLLALISKAIVGTLHFAAGQRPRLRHSGTFGMTVRKAYWGLGIGSLMLDTLIDWAKVNRVVKKINLRVRTDNQRAILLYERKGFVIEGTIRREILLDGNYFDQYWMGLIIE